MLDDINSVKESAKEALDIIQKVKSNEALSSYIDNHYWVGQHVDKINKFIHSEDTTLDDMKEIYKSVEGLQEFISMMKQLIEIKQL